MIRGVVFSSLLPTRESKLCRHFLKKFKDSFLNIPISNVYARKPSGMRPHSNFINYHFCDPIRELQLLQKDLINSL